MDKIIITIPNWVICVGGIWFVLLTVKTTLEIYFSHLERKLKRIEETTSTTGYYSLETLLYAVETKFSNETRFDTALRYIKEAENKPSFTGKIKEKNESKIPV